MGNPNFNFSQETMNEEIRTIVDQETRKSPDRMDLNLIIDGLDYLHPFNEREDELRTRAAWNDFQKRYVLRYMNRCGRARTLRRVIAAALLTAVLLATTICYALGIDLWSVVVDWTKEQLNLYLTPNSTADTQMSEDTDVYSRKVRSVWGNELCETLIESGIHVALPSWIPDGFELQECSAKLHDRNPIVYARYATEDSRVIVVYVRRMQNAEGMKDINLSYEADERLQDVYEVSDVKYYMVSNIDNSALSWNDGMYNIFISGDISYEEMRSMVESIL